MNSKILRERIVKSQLACRRQSQKSRVAISDDFRALIIGNSINRLLRIPHGKFKRKNLHMDNIFNEAGNNQLLA